MIAPGWKSLLDEMLSSAPDSLEPVLKVVQLTPVEYGEGWFRLVWSPTDDWVNPKQHTIFGGAAAAALEYAFGGAIVTMLEDFEAPAAVRLEQDYVRPVLREHNYSVVGRVVARSKRLMFCRGEISDASGEPVVLGSGVCSVTRTGIA